jgi:hypothetical protein
LGEAGVVEEKIGDYQAWVPLIYVSLVCSAAWNGFNYSSIKAIEDTIS